MFMQANLIKLTGSPTHKKIKVKMELVREKKSSHKNGRDIREVNGDEYDQNTLCIHVLMFSRETESIE